MNMNKYKKDQWNLAWLKSSTVKRIWKILSSNGAKVYFVGGCVRDTIQNRKIKDIDIATDSLPSEVVKMAREANLKVITTGYEHGSVSVVIEQECFEITTFRSDTITDGRHSKVSFSSNIVDDSQRRDFTMNAVYMTINGNIIDPISGMKDLIHGQVRFIGEPEKRIHEDYLRVLRYFRFLSIYDENLQSIDYDTVKACSNAVHSLKILSHNRVWGELQRILLADNPYLVLQVMLSYGILDQILPFATTEGLQRYLKIERKFESEFKEINRLAMLNISFVKDWAKNFPLKKEQKRWLERLLNNLKDSSSLRVKGYKYKKELATVAFAILKSKSVTTLDKNDFAEIKLGSSRQFPVKSSDLIDCFCSSKELGDELKRLKEVWFASDLELSRNELIAESKKNRYQKKLRLKNE